MKTSKVYKVVREDLTSAMMDIPSKYRLTYAVNKRVKPLIGKIFAFSNLESAKEYASQKEFDLHFKYRIYLANAKIRNISPQRCFMYTIEDNLERFWKTPKINPNTICPVPEGTVFCDWLTLKEEV